MAQSGSVARALAPRAIGRARGAKAFTTAGPEISSGQLSFVSRRNRSGVPRPGLPGVRGSEDPFLGGLDAAVGCRGFAQTPVAIAGRTRLPEAAAPSADQDALRHRGS